MIKIIQAPSKYIQGANALKEIGNYISPLGKSALVLADDFVMNLVGEKVRHSLDSAKISSYFEKFNEECTHDEIKRLTKLVKENKYEVVLGLGGGKVIDTAKAVAHFAEVPVIVAPTIASTDAPTSALSVIYTPKGEFDSYLMLPKNPEMVVMDTSIISQAPVRLLVSGMGDALATYFEARACTTTQQPTMAGGTATLAAFTLAELCYDTLLADGYKAKLAVEAGACTPAVENIIEANTLLSGIGFESAGLGAAHAIHNGMTALEECHHMYHGEKVAFGTLVQLVMENGDAEELENVLAFCVALGLPVTLKELGVTAEGDELKEKVMAVAKASCAEGESIHNMPFKVTADSVYSAILATDRIGSEWV